MKLYNPITGKQITTSDFNFPLDSSRDFSNVEGNELLTKYPFLVNMNQDWVKPDSCNDVQRSGVDTVISKKDTSQLIDVIESENKKLREAILRLTSDEKMVELICEVVGLKKIITGYIESKKVGFFKKLFRKK